MLAYLKIIRPVNLGIIVLSQFLLREMVFVPILKISGTTPQLDGWQFLLLVLSTVLIAAAGYVINDINDTGMDSVNKPSKVIAGRIIPLATAKNYYYALNAAGIAAGIVLSYTIGKWELSILFLIIATMLYYYTYKYQYLTFWGNFTVSLLAGATIGIVWLFEFFAFRKDPEMFVEAFHAFRYLNIFTAAYAVFAFLSTMSREITKDIQDRVGDAKNGCRTIAVRYGESTARIIVTVLNALIISGLIVFQLWLSDINLMKLMWSLIIPQVLVAVATVLTFFPETGKNYRIPGNLMKVSMFTGLITMVFVYIR